MLVPALKDDHDGSWLQWGKKLQMWREQRETENQKRNPKAWSHHSSLKGRVKWARGASYWRAERASLWDGPTPGEDAVRPVSDHKGLRTGHELSWEGWEGFERTDSSFERSRAVRKMLSNRITYCKEIVHERKRQSTCSLRCRLIVRKGRRHPSLHRPPHSASSASLEAGPPPAELSSCSWRLKWWVALLVIKYF